MSFLALSVMAVNVGNLRMLRSLIRELRLINVRGSVRNAPAYQFILDQFRTHQVTSKRVCKGDNDMEHLGNTCLCFLNSGRKAQELSEIYQRGERSIEESARLVGLSLPETYKDTDK